MPRGICNGTFGKWGDNRVKVHFQMGQFDSAKIVLKVPSYRFTFEAHIEGTFITIMYMIEQNRTIMATRLDSVTK